MKEIKCTIKEFFDVISELNNIQFELNNEFILPHNVQVRDENSNWINVLSIIIKQDRIRTITYNNGDISKVADKHLISYDKKNCKYASELNIGDSLVKANNSKIQVSSNELSEEYELVYDIEVDSDTHLFQTANGIIHHNTIAAFSIATALNRPRFDFNLGNTGDPRSALIGNTHFNKEKGTFFAESYFVKAIQTENAVIVLDELTRAHPDTWNILMSVIDYKQRYLRLDDKDTSDKISVAKGVSFIATANIGIEYTATRQIDRALTDRFTILEIPVLTSDQEYELLKQIYPNLDDNYNKAIADYADGTRQDILADDSKISTIISTRMSIEFAGLVYDGFSLKDAAEVAIMPFYSDGDERQYMKQRLQKYIIMPEVDSNTTTTYELFTEAEKAELTGN